MPIKTGPGFRQRVEGRLGQAVSDEQFCDGVIYAQHKLDIYRQRYPEHTYYDEDYLVQLTADTIREQVASDYYMAMARIMAEKPEEE